jgi:serine/threonine-protein kinase
VISTEEFVQNLADSGLLTSIELPAQSVADGSELASNLVAAKLLTPYQANAIMEGRLGDLRIGNYQILERLGGGGMGVVYKARHQRMKRVVAIKVLSAEIASEPALIKRFQREVEIIARFTHPNVVMAFDADEAEQGPFLVMEFVNGVDLAREVIEHGALSVADAIDCTIQVARGLGYVHDEGIVHRDVKPANLIRDVSGVIKVTDLGIARLDALEDKTGARSLLTQAGSVMGTTAYMAPEQAVDSHILDRRADIYSLGCTLYFLLTGSPPYRSESAMGVFIKHRDFPIPRLCKALPDIPPKLDSIYQRMVAKKPEDRYPTMTDVIKDLEALQKELRSIPPTVKAATDQTIQFSASGEEILPDEAGFTLSSPGELKLAALTVLLVEPSRTQAAIIRKQLQDLGIASIQTARSGLETLDTLKSQPISVIVSTMQLADMTGAELARQILAAKSTKAAGIVLATSEADQQKAGALPQHPRLVLLRKPFDLQQLSNAITSVTD